METKNIHFEEKVSDIVKLHNWDISKARFLGFAFITVNGVKHPVCLLVLPDCCKYHTMDGIEHQTTDRLNYTPIKHDKDNRRVFTDKDIYVVLRIKDGFAWWLVNSGGGTTEPLQKRQAAILAAR